jgi:hypothetical protein
VPVKGAQTTITGSRFWCGSRRPTGLFTAPAEDDKRWREACTRLLPLLVRCERLAIPRRDARSLRRASATDRVVRGRCPFAGRSAMPLRAPWRITRRAITASAGAGSSNLASDCRHQPSATPNSRSSVAGPVSRVVLVMIGSAVQASSSVVTVPSAVSSIRSNGSMSGEAMATRDSMFASVWASVVACGSRDEVGCSSAAVRAERARMAGQRPGAVTARRAGGCGDRLCPSRVRRHTARDGCQAGSPRCGTATEVPSCTRTLG